MPKPYECIDCGRKLQCLSRAQKHPKHCPSIKYTANHNPQKTNKFCFCGYCGGTFTHSARLQFHVWDHFDEGRIHCCGQNFGSVKLLKAHQQAKGCAVVDLNRPPPDSPKDLFGCCINQCGRKFPDVIQLRRVTSPTLVKHCYANNVKEPYVRPPSKLSFL